MASCLVALGLRRDDKKEIIDFHLAQSESAGPSCGLPGRAALGLAATAASATRHLATVANHHANLPGPNTCAGAGSAGATNPAPSARKSGPPTPSSAASPKSSDEPGRWGSFPTEPQWTASSSPSSTTKTATRASAPLSRRHKPFDVTPSSSPLNQPIARRGSAANKSSMSPINHDIVRRRASGRATDRAERDNRQGARSWRPSNTCM